MKIVRRSSLDRTSLLPSNIIEHILTFMPLRDAARTSILSRRWRYQWAKLPQLVFDDSFHPTSQENPRDILMKIYEILLLHQGPISKFTLNIPCLTSCSEIDKLILFLSRNGIQDFTLYMSMGEYKLPSNIFSCLNLRHLFLRSCVFEPPRTFKGFDKLISLELWEVNLPLDLSISNCPLLESLTLGSTTVIDSLSIDAPHLKSFWFIGLMNCVSFINAPLLALLSFVSDALPFPGEHTFDLLKVFDCVPHIERLNLDNLSVKLLGVHNAPKVLPTPLNCLRCLQLTAICFKDMDEHSCTFSLIRSSPNLQELTIEAAAGSDVDVELPLEYLELQDCSDFSFNKLRQVQMRNVSGWKPELQFIRFLLAKSPALEKMQIEHGFTNRIDMNFVKTIVELTRFGRASQKAEIIFPSLDLD